MRGQNGSEQTGRRQCAQGAVKKRSQTKTKMAGATTWTKRSTTSGEFMAIKKSSSQKAAKKFKGVQREKY
jgi:hypothetical protein